MRRELTVATVSWINRTPNPITTAVEASTLEPDWIPKTCLGLAATSNPDPGEAQSDANKFRGTKQFRAMTYTKIAFTADDRTGAVSAVDNLESWLDPGYTPPFSQTSFPLTFLAPDTAVWSFAWYAGEMSPLSKICYQARHPNSVITGVGASETVLVNALIKFRAGKHTDDVGINNVGCPFHVPWVYSEVLVTLASGQIKLYGRGSKFPSHRWYVDGKSVAKNTQVADTSFPKKPLIPIGIPRIPGMPFATATNPLAINETAMLLYPALSAGAPASGPQTTLTADAKLTTPVDTHPNAVDAQPIVTATI
jgi:hypothetical protein